MNLVITTIIISAFMFYTALLSASPRVRILYKNPVDQVETRIQKRVKSSANIASAIAVVNDNYILDIDIVIGGEDGPLYDDEKSEITIPYSFIKEVWNRFIKANYKDTGVSPEQATIHVLMHTLYHELAHAFIAKYELPVVGKEEDAADGLAALLLIEYFEDGQEIAISAADLFDLESNDNNRLEEYDFWDEHSLDAQRFYSTLCHVYGSKPEKYRYIIEQSDFSEERAELCTEEYENLSRSWFHLLKPHIRLRSNLNVR